MGEARRRKALDPNFGKRRSTEASYGIWQASRAPKRLQQKFPGRIDVGLLNYWVVRTELPSGQRLAGFAKATLAQCGDIKVSIVWLPDGPSPPKAEARKFVRSHEQAFRRRVGAKFLELYKTAQVVILEK